MTQRDAERILELEEAAEGVELFRVPGDRLRVEDAAEQAVASGWIPLKESGEAGLDRARSSRRSLRRAMNRLETVVARPSGQEGWLAGVDAALADVGDALQGHIQEVERTDGVLAEIVEREPRLVSEVEAMRQEHAELLDSWKQARRTLSVKAATDIWGVRRAVNSLLGRLLMHRQDASDLVYEAYHTDIAAND